MIEKILDKYYLKKLKQEIGELIKDNYHLDYKFKKNGDYHISLFVKKKEYNNTMFEYIAHIRKDKGLIYLTHIEDYNGKIIKAIDEYLKMNK